jgi:transcriptional regulator with XRE-family HTH domain
MHTRAPNYEALRIALGRRRSELGLTYEQLADAAGMSRTGVINLELGTHKGSLGAWFALAGALEVPFANLMENLSHPVDD